MDYRFATESDLDLLAEWNLHLIHDEGHQNRMDVPELRERMSRWLAGEYRAVIFSQDGDPVAYGLYREEPEEVYLRQFFVRCDRRRMGLGRKAMGLLLQNVWPQNKRLTVEVLCGNTAGVEFWRAVGYRDYCLTLEALPGERHVG